jgi:hypothetical protein
MQNFCHPIDYLTGASLFLTIIAAINSATLLASLGMEELSPLGMSKMREVSFGNCRSRVPGRLLILVRLTVEPYFDHL